jgi:glutamyl-tRNA synthetase
MKSDGYPTYHFANVVDDHHMKVTHVVRGSEWMSSTPLHVALHAAFGWSAPSFGHVPLLVNSEGQKLSKRHLDLDLSSFRDQGIYPDALVNFAALLGWSHQRKSDLMTLRELEQVFDLKFTKGNTVVSFDKLHFLQQQHTRRSIERGGEIFQKMVEEVSEAIRQQYDASTIQSLLRGRRLEDIVAAMLRAGKNDYISPSEFAQRCSIYFKPVASGLSFEKPESHSMKRLATAAAALCFVPAHSWTAAAHRQNILALQPDASGNITEPKVLQQTWKKEFYSFLRQAFLGGAPGPTIPEIMEILGKETCTERIRSAALAVHAGEALKKPQRRVESVSLPREQVQCPEYVRRPE